MTLQINELRVGNKVKFVEQMKPHGITGPPGPYMDVYGTVENINYWKETVTLVYFVGEIELSKLTGIPLTKEILYHQCGFAQSFSAAYNFIDKQVGDFILRLEERIKAKKSAFLLVGNGEHDDPGEMDITQICKNLHQLQNLYFSLTQTELIELPKPFTL